MCRDISWLLGVWGIWPEVGLEDLEVFPNFNGALTDWDELPRPQHLAQTGIVGWRALTKFSGFSDGDAAAQHIFN